MRVLISGAGGFIGRSLTDELVREGHVVHRAVRGEPRPGDARIDLWSRELDTSNLPGKSIEGIDAVFNLSGEALTPRRWGRAKRDRIIESRVSTTDVLSRSMAAVDNPPAVLVSMSATGYYGNRGDEVLEEGSTAGTGFLAECCRSWEAATSPARERGIRVVMMRSGVVIGNGGGALRAQLPLFRVGLGGRLGTGRQWLSWISLEDEVRALLHAARTADLSGPCNLTAPTPVRNEDFTAALAHALHRPAPLAVPRRALVLALGRRVVDEFILASQRALPQKIERSGFSFHFPEVSGAIRAALVQARLEP